MINAQDLSLFLEKPELVKDQHVVVLRDILSRFPYFHAPRAIYLKALYNQGSTEYNAELKRTAAFTQDRGVLFDFITSGTFTGLHQAFQAEKEARINEIEVFAYEIISQPKTEFAEKVNEIVIEERDSAEQATTQAAENLGVGKPLQFSQEEKHSFQEWLQLANFKQVDRTETTLADSRKRKLDLIDKFIESNPKIVPNREQSSSVKLVQDDDSQHATLMTETLAQVYLEQKKYQKAIQAYEILILKYPEKSSFFASRISDIRILQASNI
jgi:tetratricopeptide (TPR) repeat protein